MTRRYHGAFVLLCLRLKRCAAHVLPPTHAPFTPTLMTGLRILLLVCIAFAIGAVGLFLVLEPAPDEPLDEVAFRTNAVIASSASIGMGVLVPKMALAANVIEPHAGQAPVLVALARKTQTPTLRPTETPTLEPTSEPTDEPTIRPTDEVPPTAVSVTFTPAPTQPPRPTRTPRPVQPTKTPVNEEAQPTPTPPNSPVPTQDSGSAAGLNFAISGCGALTKAGGYFLKENIGGSGDCLNIRASNVVLDCQGKSIQGAGFNGVGIVVRKLGILGGERPKNVEIRNCNVSGYRYGIYVEGSSGVFIHHNVLAHNYDDVDGRRFGIFLGMVEGGGDTAERVGRRTRGKQ